MAPAVEYIAPWPLFAMTWSSSPVIPSTVEFSSASSSRHGQGSSESSRSGDLKRNLSRRSKSNHRAIPEGARLAVGSFIEEYSNRIQILGMEVGRDGHSELALLADAAHPYPATKLSFQPSTLSTTPDFPAGLANHTSSRNSYASPLSKQSKRASWGATIYTSASAANSAGLRDFFPDRELLASSADCLRIWEISRNESYAYEQEEEARRGSGFVTGSSHRRRVGSAYDSDGRLRFELVEKSVLAHSKSANSPPAPLTSFSWNVPSPSLIVTSSIDTTCTIWDLPTRTALTQLIAHDREVYDVDWCPGSSDVFASVGADGSVRVFDLRSLEHSTIIYETTTAGGIVSRPGTSYDKASVNGSTTGRTFPLLRIAFNPWDANYLATFHLESESVQILDVRAPGAPILELKGHSASINSVSWGPPGGGSGLGPSKGMVCTGGDDSQCLVYDLASATLRSASAQGRRSRNSNNMTPGGNSSSAASSSGTVHGGPSPAPPSSMSAYSSSSTAFSTRIAAEHPVLAYTSHEMVNNVSWLRAPLVKPEPAGSGSGGGSGSGRRDSTGVVQEWDEFAKGVAGPGNAAAAAVKEPDWLALVSGNAVRALRV
ncbi:WD40 repeat-like protein [Tilletiaria anomala UBC 951]|uniref:WD40 repeat-like protein n=1 Tax=Tilletiaria anomala (strain ATCC 24038 / CBS 436.72 / UBC 951) TaxID=1037660 RepID=A0A066VX99_TILAU|nr:WD40 repeat-like protein [Tilletiaria anomala UBC 951]KDN46126.1 WD40 repeat-like protein [Tilletiaria anomala UBC 951]